ncbi:MAG: hypothetical protein ACO1NX_01185, partial [Chitinophagaceae bacterium]
MKTLQQLFNGLKRSSYILVLASTSLLFAACNSSTASSAAGSSKKIDTVTTGEVVAELTDAPLVPQ